MVKRTKAKPLWFLVSLETGMKLLNTLENDVGRFEMKMEKEEFLFSFHRLNEEGVGEEGEGLGNEEVLGGRMGLWVEEENEGPEEEDISCQIQVLITII